MADSRIFQILEAIQRKCSANFSSKTSGINMDTRVEIGTVIEPPFMPYGCVSFLDYTTEHGPTLGRYRMLARFEIYLYVGGGDVSERIQGALNLCSDVIESITADRFLGLGSGMLDDVMCDFTAIDGDKYGLEGVGIGYIEVSTPFQSSTGI